MSKLSTLAQASVLKNTARLLFVPTGTKSLDEKVFEPWASDPPKDNVLKVSDFVDLSSTPVVNKLILDFCPDVKSGNSTLQQLVDQQNAHNEPPPPILPETETEG